MSTIPLLDASNVDLCKQYLGKKVEVIGTVHEVVDWSRIVERSAAYINVNLGDYRKEIVKLIIQISMVNDKAWRGRHPETWKGMWISAVGVLTDRGPRGGSVHEGHLVINLERESDCVLLHEVEAKRKLLEGRNSKSTAKAQVNDTVDYVEVSLPEKLETIRIVSIEGDVPKGQINQNAPLAVKILGKEIGEEFEFNIPTQKMKTLRIVMIHRPS